MKIVHLMASPFYGGPERQVLGLARHLDARFETVFLSFPEAGNCQPFLGQARRHGFPAHALENNTPHYRRAIAEVARRLRELRADVVCTSGYKPDILGWRAARQVSVPVVSISHGWTGATWKVRLNEAIDRFVIRWMDAVVCVSHAQADKVRRSGVRDERIQVIHNAVGEEAFAPPDPAYAAFLRGLFARAPRWVVGAAGRLSPEKGFDVLVESARIALGQNPDLGFVIFGDGPQRELLRRRIAQHGLESKVILAGFRDDVVKYLPHLDLVVLPSFTEGLPIVLLEACAAGVPVVATAVGGIPEVIEDGKSGLLAPPGEPAALAGRFSEMFRNEARRRELGETGRVRVRREFTFAVQSRKYEDLFERVHRTAVARNAGNHPRPAVLAKAAI